MTDTPAAAERQPSPPGTRLRLREPRNRVSRKAIGWWALHAAAGWLVVIAAQLVARFAVPSAPGWLLITALCCAGVGSAHILVMPRWRFHVHRWEVTDQAVYTQAGWFNLQWRIAPISRIQTVDTKRDLLEQLFDLATVTVTTASAAGAVEINGLDHTLAARIVDDLTVRAQRHSGDAT